MRRAALEIMTALLLGTACLPAGAEPLVVDGKAGVDRLARLVDAYAGAARVRWVVSTPDAASRAVVLKQLADRVGPDLVERIRAEAGPADAPVSAWVETAQAPAKTDCSWQVTLTDPSLPSPGEAPVPIALSKGDRLPASGDARFEVGFSGPLQSTLYAFAETAPGAIRDLAAAPDIAISVEPAAAETLVLVRARRPVPWLDQIKTGLAATPGERASLGEDYALASRFSGRSRGIGALIQLMDPTMVVASADVPAQPAPPARKADEPKVADADLLETCLYTLTPKVGM